MAPAETLADDAVPVTVSALTWGARRAARRALLIHGLGSSGATWWRLADGLARAGYRVVAPDLRGHGASPRTATYRLADHVADLAELNQDWDLVVGHSLGGLVATALARALATGRATRVLLLDPVFEIPAADLAGVVSEQLAELHTATDVSAQRAAHPSWHSEDIALKAAAAAATSAFVVEHCLLDNAPWQFTGMIRDTTVPTNVLAADPALGAAFRAGLGPELTSANPGVRVRTVLGAGHSIHRDQPGTVLAAAVDSRAE